MKIDYRWVQSRLVALGFNPGPIDGLRGPRTDAAVVAFKRSVGIRARAYIGPLTLAALSHKADPPDETETLPWLRVLNSVRGLHEVRDFGALSKFLKSDGRTLGDPRKYPWCGDLEETIFRVSLPDEPFPGALGRNPYWARNWLLFGRSLDVPLRGCVGVWARGSGGHVANIIGHDARNWYVDGGNQSNAINRVRISKTGRKLLGVRWPISYNHPPEPLPVMTPGDLILSTNEA